MGFGMKDKVKDTITGFGGIITARCEYLTGTVTYQVEGPTTDPSKVPGSDWYDETRLEIVPNP